MAQRNYQICNNCVMDTTDTQIRFNSNGMCDHCSGFYRDIQPHWHTDEKARRELWRIVERIKTRGEGKDFDCLLGMSGGLDSSYMLHCMVKDFGLRPLVFHVDGGWNSEVAVNNIEVLVDGLGLDLYTEVINWEEMKDFQLAFFKAGVPHIDIPQDHAFIATLYKFASQYKIKCILNGGNFATECVRNPLEWFYYGTDLRQLKDIHKRFGSIPLKTYPFSGILYHKVYLRFIKGVKVIKPLNYMPYIKNRAIELLSREYGWKSYPQKHFESRFTKFYEGYWLPEKFGYDTRRVQFSSLILSEQLTRDQALVDLANPPFDQTTIGQDFEYVASKLGISTSELQSYMDQPNKSYQDYKSQEWMFLLGARIMKGLGMERAIKR